MVINVINLKHRENRRSTLIDHLYDMRCNYEIWDGIFNPAVMPYINITKSHQMIVRDAKDKGLKSIAIAEDDLRFSSEYSLKCFTDNIPEEYDLYFGMIYSGNIQDRRITHGFSGMQFYMIHSRFYDRFLQAPDNKHLDMWLGQDCHKYQFYCCDPFICYGESGWSDNFNRPWKFEESKLPRNLLKDGDYKTI